MVILQVTSLTNGAGKTAICAGLGSILVKQGKKVGYFKPLSVNSPDTDASFMKQTLTLSDPEAAICPVFAGDTALKAGVKASFDKIAPGKDVVLVESASKEITSTLGAKVLLVVTYADMDALPPVSRGTGVIINKVPASQLKTIKEKKLPLLQKSGLNVLGILPEEKTIASLSVNELAGIIDGQITSNPEMKDQILENFMLGAMTVDSALPYFKQKNKKVAIIRAERADMQLAALATDTRALVLYGETPIIPMIALKAKDKEAPVITTKLDANALTQRLEEAAGKTKFNQAAKLPRLVELMSEHIDLPALYKMLGII